MGKDTHVEINIYRTDVTRDGSRSEEKHVLKANKNFHTSEQGGKDCLKVTRELTDGLEKKRSKMRLDSENIFKSGDQIDRSEYRVKVEGKSKLGSAGFETSAKYEHN